jgi:hypothetical protein
MTSRFRVLSSEEFANLPDAHFSIDSAYIEQKRAVWLSRLADPFEPQSEIAGARECYRQEMKMAGMPREEIARRLANPERSASR